jgi:isopentenyl diphosphate isomerase/L-lactate dehydrogenase-like FMN-dependent dehydrogenase
MPPSPPKFLSLADVERAALAVLPPPVLGYYASGAEDESTLAANVAAWRRWAFVPRVLVDVSAVDVSTSLLGQASTMPVAIAPMAMMRLAHTQGELAVARAAANAGVPMVISTMGTTPLADVAAAAGGGTAFQLYVTKDRAFCRSLVRAAETAGCSALVVTVDVPVLGKREADERNGFALPPGLRLANLEGLMDDGNHASPTGPTLANARDASAGASADTADAGSRLAALFQRNIDASLTWAFVDWLKGVTQLPIWIKGVLSPADAATAVSAGVAGIVVSNHGGRQLDGAIASVDALPAIVDAVAGAVPILVDGGVRRGSDVLRAILLGADGVLLGRPVLYGLAVGGVGGVARVLDIVRDELVRSAALAGVARVADAKGRRDLLVRVGEMTSKL